jgi:alpha-1,3-rhamnosyl/mannosyltransferase
MVSTRGSPASPIGAVRAKYAVADQPFVLAFGAADPRKNTRRVLEAWAALPSGLRERFFLLVVGMPDAAIPTFRRLATGLLPSGGWQLRGFADEEDLPAQVTSNTTSLPEAGDAAVLVDPTDTSALARALEDLLSDDRSRAEVASR